MSVMTKVEKREAQSGTSNWAGVLRTATLSNATGLLTRTVRWCLARQKARAASRMLHVDETVSLGQKRFAAVIRVENTRYLIGGGANDVVLLAALGKEANAGAAEQGIAVVEAAALPVVEQAAAPAFSDVLEQANTQRKPKPVKAAAGRSKGGTKQCA